jgi:hypothetical protein
LLFRSTALEHFESALETKKIFFWTPSAAVVDSIVLCFANCSYPTQGCQILLGTKYQKTGDNVPNDHNTK